MISPRVVTVIGSLKGSEFIQLCLAKKLLLVKALGEVFEGFGLGLGFVYSMITSIII
jgi:hypothetical protein